MGFFAKLFGKDEESSDNKNTSLNCKIAASCFRCSGYSSDEDSLDNTVVSILQSQNLKVSFKEYYFYEEAAFYLMNTLEIDQRFDLIDTYISLFDKSPDNTEEAVEYEILKCLKSSAMKIAADRLRLVGIHRTLSDKELSAFIDQRYLEYEKLAKNQIACPEPIQLDKITIGLTPRDHPLKIYLGAIADNISNSLAIDKENVLYLTLLEIAILKNYLCSLTAGNSFVAIMQKEILDI